MGPAVIPVQRLTIADAGRLLRKRELSSLDLTRACLDRIASLEPVLNAFITVTADHALAAAEQADLQLAAGVDRGPLHGIPVAVKDLCATAGVRTTAGSKVLEDWVPDFDATVVTKLREAGAVSLGKLNLHEFAYGTTSANVFYGPVHNPWALDCHPGGSSGGSGAAVAAGECFGAIGSDTGGSIRIPAALCGTVGLMPTYGLVSRAGVTPLSWSLDHLGPLARTVEDAALFLNAIAGHDPADPASAEVPGFDATAELGRDIAGLRIGVARSQFRQVEPEVRDSVDEAISVLERLGAHVSDVDLPMLDAGLRLTVLMAEASAYHAEWLRERPQDYSDQVRTLLQWGLTIPAHEYLNDLRLRRQFTNEVRAAMQSVDVIAMPTCPAVTCPIADGESDYRYAALTGPWDFTGQPVISVPCGFGARGLPVGLSLAGRPFEEALLCRTAHAYEQATPWHKRHPEI
jgi:aspartyl-tRNA(Asn)/glutamyl-tRNA(Gln) amidotransferase subunit A